MSTATQTFEHRHVLYNVPWEVYQQLRADNSRAGLRMTYDRGSLEIMSPSRKHERIATLIGRMIDHWTLLHGVEIAAGRNTTFSRKDLDRGLEPDNCYWITHEEQMRDTEEVDLTMHPPPDLALEVDVTRSSIPKLPIYQALGVPEVWRWQHDLLEVVRLDASGEYRPRRSSKELPKFPLDLAAKIIAEREGQGDNALIKLFIRKIKPKR